MIAKILKYKEKYSDLIVIPKSTKVSNEKTISYDKKTTHFLLTRQLNMII